MTPDTPMTPADAPRPAAPQTETPSETALRLRIDALRVAIDASVDDLNLDWTRQAEDETGLRYRAIHRLQTARTADDIANGRDWQPASVAALRAAAERLVDDLSGIELSNPAMLDLRAAVHALRENG